MENNQVEVQSPPRALDISTSITQLSEELAQITSRLMQAETAVVELRAARLVSETRLGVLQELHRNFGSHMGSMAAPTEVEVEQEAGASIE
jgi:fido (protein-threonine AMPylation protein)